MAELFANNASTTLSGNGGSITSGATSLIVASASQFPATGNFRIIIGSEIMLVTGVSGTTFTVSRAVESTVAASHNDGDAVTCILTAGSISAILSAMEPQGRVTLTTGVPDMVSSVTGATTVYYTPALGDWIKIYDGASWGVFSFTELSQATTDATKSPAACANNSNYDIFVWNNSGTIRATRGPAWSSDTSRGTGAGTTELTRLNGVLVNANAITNGPVANRGTYVGSVRTNGSAQVDMIFGGVGAAGGENTIQGIWNMYNRRFCCLMNFDNTDIYTYGSVSLRIKNNNNANKISFIVGWQGDGISAANYMLFINNNAGVGVRSFVGLDSTTAAATGSITGFGRNSSANGRQSLNPATYVAPAPLGFHYVAPLEQGSATGTNQFYGDDGGVLDLTGFTLTTMF